MEQLLTIIVPIYNVEKYIDTCLKSMANQTIKGHKVILVNDGSKDNSGSICEKYVKEYPDIFEYVIQENMGLGEARNTGMKYVRTPFLTFIDSDDWLDVRFVDCFGKLIDKLGVYPDIVFNLPWIYNSITKWIVPWYDKEVYERVFEVHDNTSSVRTNAKLRPEMYSLEVSSCRKIYRTKFIEDNSFSFPKGLKWEDVPGHFFLLHRAELCVAMPEASFFYRTEQGGSITSGGGKTRLDIIPIFERLYDMQIQDNFSDIEKGYVLRFMINFTIWFIESTNEEYLDDLLKGLHEVFSKFSEEDITFYLNRFQSESVDENMRIRGLITCLRSDGYLELKNYDSRNDAMMNYSIRGIENLKRMSQTGKQLLREHGVVYTAKETINKLKGKV